MNNLGCYFSPYMIANSTMQLVFGRKYRKEQEKISQLNQEFQEWISEQQINFENNLEEAKRKWLQEKLQYNRTLSRNEKYAANELKFKATELGLFFQTSLSMIDSKCIPTIAEIAESYRKKGYTSDCPIIVLLLHTLQEEIDYHKIHNALEKKQENIGNVSFKPWCIKNTSHNSAIYNLHAIMGNIPTIIVSPFCIGDKIYFSTAMWEAQKGAKPLIRSLFSFDFNYNMLDNNEGKITIQKKITHLTTLISGCARDAYMLFSFGNQPTLPSVIKNDKELQQFLLEKENEEVRQFILKEYGATKDLLSNIEYLDESVRELLTQQVNNTFEELSILFNKQQLLLI